MRAASPAISALGPLQGRHLPPPGRLRAARRPSRPQSGPLRAFRTQRWTPGYPPETRECPSTPFPRAAGSAAIRHHRARVPPRTSIRGGRPLATWQPPAQHRVAYTEIQARALRLTYWLLQAHQSLSTGSNPQQLPVLPPPRICPHPEVGIQHAIGAGCPEPVVHSPAPLAARPPPRRP